MGLISKIKSFINLKRYKYRPVMLQLDETYEIRSKTSYVISIIINIIVTGIAVRYILTHNNFLKWGLLVFIVQYYMEWIIKEIKRK